MADEKVFELAQELEQHRRDEAVKNRVQYNNFSTTCTHEGCGATLPEVRWKIGICIDCAEDIEREKAARERNGL